jgi:hypothetical protein
MVVAHPETQGRINRLGNVVDSSGMMYNSPTASIFIEHRGRRVFFFFHPSPTGLYLVVAVVVTLLFR